MLEVGWGHTGPLFKALDKIAGVAEAGHLRDLGDLMVGVFQQRHSVIDANLIKIVIEIHTGFFLEKETKIGRIDIVLAAKILYGNIFHEIVSNILHCKGANGAEPTQMLLHHHQIHRQNVIKAIKKNFLGGGRLKMVGAEHNALLRIGIYQPQRYKQAQQPGREHIHIGIQR